MLLRRLLVAGLFLPLTLLAYTSPGKPSGFVNDFGQMLTSGTVSVLNQTLSNFSQQTGNQISVVTIPNLGGDTIENYAQALFKDWGIGQVKNDNGVLLLISRDDRQMRIEVGYGLEPIITDIESSHIISDVLRPSFQVGDYDGGVQKAVARMIQDINQGVPLTTSQNAITPTTTFNFSLLTNLFYPIILVMVVLASILGRSKSWWAGGVVGGVAGLLVWIFVKTILGFVFLIPLGLLLDFLASRAYERHKNGGPRPPWYFGGGMGGRGSFGGGGFGGFGGGMSGGGGSSGKW